MVVGEEEQKADEKNDDESALLTGQSFLFERICLRGIFRSAMSKYQCQFVAAGLAMCHIIIHRPSEISAPLSFLLLAFAWSWAI